VISGNLTYGIAINGVGTDINRVEGNYVGTDAAGATAIAGYIGIEIRYGPKSNTIGGTDPLARNVISGHTNIGISLIGAGTDNNLVQGNYIGLDALARHRLQIAPV